MNFFINLRLSIFFYIDLCNPFHVNFKAFILTLNFPFTLIYIKKYWNLLCIFLLLKIQRQFYTN